MRKFVPIALILLAGAALRFSALDRQSLWDDEMSSLKTASISLPQMMDRFQTWETHPPFYFLQLKAWIRFIRPLSPSPSPAPLSVLRANSALWGTLSIFLLFLLGRRYGGETLGLWAAAFLAFSPIHLAYSQEVRPYAMELCLGIAGFLLLGKPGPLLVLLFTAELYTHYWGGFLIAAQLIWGWVSAPSKEYRWRLFFCALAAGILFLPWLPILQKQIQVVQDLTFWIPDASLMHLAKTWAAYCGIVFRFASSTFVLPAPLPIQILAVTLMTLAALLGFWKGPKAARVWLIAGLGIPFLLSYRLRSLYVWYRYPALMLPAFALMIAGGVSAFPKIWLRRGIGGLLLIPFLWGCGYYFTGWEKASAKPVVEYIRLLEKDSTVIVRPAYFGELFHYYYGDKGRSPVIDQHTLDTPEARRALRGKRILLVAFDVPDDPVSEALCSEFDVVSIRQFPGHSHLGITVYQLQ